MRTRDEQLQTVPEVGSMNLSGIEELQADSRAIFERAIGENVTPPWLTQLLAIFGTVLFWGFMAGPIVSIYHQYFSASYESLVAGEVHPEGFPHPHPSLIVTSVILSLLPLIVYAMVVLTVTLSNGKVRRVSSEIEKAHSQSIERLRSSGVIRLEFEDRLLQQAEFLLNLSRTLPQDTNRIS